MNLKGDWINIFVLLMLYTMQTLPQGIGSIISIILKTEYNASYEDLAIYSLSMWPYSLKLLWAPLVDALHVQNIGRRKSWLVPVQYTIGIILICMAYYNDDLLPKTETPSIKLLTYVFFTLNFLCATQDVVVDGWALTMLKKNNIGYASTCNVTGQAMGMIIGSIVPILFTSEDFCNKYFRTTPDTGGIVTIKSFFYGCGILFMIVTTLVAIFKKEIDITVDGNHEKSNISQTYLLIWEIFKSPSVQILSIILLTAKIGFAATDHLTTLKLVDAGVSRNDIILISTLTNVINCILPFSVAKHTSGLKPIRFYLNAVFYKLFLSIPFVMMIYYSSDIIQFYGIEHIPGYYYLILVILLVTNNILSTITSLCMMAFFTRISDPCYGGTYMTLLNTILNISVMSTATVAIGITDLLTVNKCSTIDNNNCSTFDLKDICEANQGNCITVINGYYVEMALFTIIGIVWYVISKDKLINLQNMILQWTLPVKNTICENENAVKYSNDCL